MQIDNLSFARVELYGDCYSQQLAEDISKACNEDDIKACVRGLAAPAAEPNIASEIILSVAAGLVERLIEKQQRDWYIIIKEVMRHHGI